MDLEQAIQKHGEWKVKFRSAIARHDTLEAGVIAKDNCCELGQWLYGEAKTRWGSLPAYGSCVATHAVSILGAAMGAPAITAKTSAAAAAMLGPQTPYASVSRDVVVAIMQLKRDAAL